VKRALNMVRNGGWGGKAVVAALRCHITSVQVEVTGITLSGLSMTSGVLRPAGQFGFLRLLGAFAELRKATVSCVCPFAWNNSAPTGRILMKFGI
jgi:hypothetical protein